jgi:hypothetical protein
MTNVQFFNSLSHTRDPREPRSGEPGSTYDFFGRAMYVGAVRFLSSGVILGFLDVEECRWSGKISRNVLGNEA